MSGPRERLPYWIQRADFEAQDFDPVTLDGAYGVLDNHDWKGELEFEAELIEQDEECCPPGVGFSREAESCLDLFHACPDEEGLWTVHYFFPDQSRRGLIASGFGLLGRVRVEQCRETANSLWPERVREALRCFFLGDSPAVLDALEGQA